MISYLESVIKNLECLEKVILDEFYSSIGGYFRCKYVGTIDPNEISTRTKMY
jgi:hypothetical protein